VTLNTCAQNWLNHVGKCTNACESTLNGINAYAYRQASVFIALATQFYRRWVLQTNHLKINVDWPEVLGLPAGMAFTMSSINQTGIVLLPK
jgi:hypothetical protein